MSQSSRRDRRPGRREDDRRVRHQRIDPARAVADIEANRQEEADAEYAERDVGEHETRYGGMDDEDFILMNGPKPTGR